MQSICREPAAPASIRIHVANDRLEAFVERRPEWRLELFPFGHGPLDLSVVFLRGVEDVFFEGREVNDAELAPDVGAGDELANDIPIKIVPDVGAEFVAQRGSHVLMRFRVERFCERRENERLSATNPKDSKTVVRVALRQAQEPAEGRYPRIANEMI